MSDVFMSALEDRTNVTYTENDAVAKKTTKSNVLDFFAQGGAMRNRKEQEIYRLFNRAYVQNPLLALRTAFYLRDIRCGQGERRVFRVIIKEFAKDYPKVLKPNLELIPEYGRWDDLYAVFNTPLQEEVGKIFYEQIQKDLESDNPSLCAKWLKSENASSDTTKKLATITRKMFGWTSRRYRKTLSKLRKKIGVVERKMSDNRWKEIDYEKVPSKAGLIYRNAFERHDPSGYQEFLDKLESGEVDINASTLFPYELARKVDEEYLESHERTVINEMWENLPDYIGEKNENSIAVVDTSASMDGLPKQVALSLGLYLAEKNEGPFHNKFITFSVKPELMDITGNNFIEKYRNMWGAHWDGNTNIEAVFDLILDIAVKNHLSQEDIPSKLYIISDMQFDSATSGSTGIFNDSPTIPEPDKTLFEKIKAKFERANYEMPELVFWNVDAKDETFPFDKDDRGFQLVSGCSPTIFEHTMKGEFLSPMELVKEVVNDDRYQPIEV